MSKLNGLQKLYPHLRFEHIQPPVRSKSEPPQPTQVVKPVETETKKPPEPVTKVEKPQTPEPPVEPVVKPKSPVKKVKKTKSPNPPPKQESHKQVEIVSPPKEERTKFVSERPKSTKPKPKGQPLRDNPVPKKGEKGLQKKYTLEQKKEMYLEQLSKKSVKRAEQEVSKVNEVLSKVDHSPTRLAKEEREIKNRLKLINTAKFFIIRDEDTTNIKEDVTSKSRKTTEEGNLSSKPEEKPSVQEDAYETSDESEPGEEC